MRMRGAPWGELKCLALVVVLISFPDLSLASEAVRPAFKRYVEAALSDIIVPDHKSFAAAAHDQRSATQQLCASPTRPNFMHARSAFSVLVGAWSRIEIYRFGPARRNNTFERLFFWPDTRGRGLRQIRRILIDQDERAIGNRTLREKSVAVQGLNALEYVLFGEGSELLAEPSQPFRCLYASALANLISEYADALVEGWTGPGSFANTMMSAGSEGNVFRSHGEVVQELIQAAAEQVEIVRDLKLKRVVGDEEKNWRPQRAPFYRSNLFLLNLRGNVEAVEALIANNAMGAILPENAKRLINSQKFESRQVLRILGSLEQQDQGLTSLLEIEQNKASLQYALQPLSGLQKLLGEDYPAQLGLSVGFNSLDGD